MSRTCVDCGQSGHFSKPQPVPYCLFCHIVGLLAGGWESNMVALLSDEEAATAREQAALLRSRLLREQAAKKLRGRKRAKPEEPDKQQSLM
jgi:hypothetical protein